MDELYAFLFAGLLIMFLLFAFFGGPQVNLYGTDQNGNINSSSSKLAWEKIDIGNFISEERATQSTKSLQNKLSVQNGIFFGSSSYSRKIQLDPEVLNTLDYATLNFDVDNTNNYGALSISVDNSTVFYETPIRGSYSVNLSDVKKDSILYINADSSGWRFWAPSQYEISGLNIEAAYTSRDAPRYEFDVPHYAYSSFYRGELRFNSIRSATLEVFLNGVPIYNRANCVGSVTVPLRKADLVPEKNTLQVTSGQDYRLEKVEAYIYYYTSQ